MIGEYLYPAVKRYEPAIADRITGMILELDNTELLAILESDEQLKDN